MPAKKLGRIKRPGYSSLDDARANVGDRQFRTYVNREAVEGAGGLRFRPKRAANHPGNLPVALREIVIQSCLDNPDLHYLKLREHLIARGNLPRVPSGTTIHGWLVEAGLSTSDDRLKRLQVMKHHEHTELTPKQDAFVREMDPRVELYERSISGTGKYWFVYWTNIDKPGDLPLRLFWIVDRKTGVSCFSPVQRLRQFVWQPTDELQRQQLGETHLHFPDKLAIVKNPRADFYTKHLHAEFRTIALAYRKGKPGDPWDFFTLLAKAVFTHNSKPQPGIPHMGLSPLACCRARGAGSREPMHPVAPDPLVIIPADFRKKRYFEWREVVAAQRRATSQE